jgi:hypothetical protein
VLLAIAGAAGPALAQQAAPVRPSAAQPVPPALPPPASAAECAQLPGGNAPVNKIAELGRPLSPKSLDLTYFNKRLADLSDEDFDRIADLASRCNRTQPQAAREVTRRLRNVIRESQVVRTQTLSKVETGKVALAKTVTSREKVEWLHDAWSELPMIAETVTKTDLREYAAWIARSLQAVYDVAPGYGQRPPPTVSEVLSVVPATPEQVTASTRTTPDSRGPLPARPWWSPRRSREDE